MLKTVLSEIWDGIGKACRRMDGWLRKRTRPPRSNVLLTVGDLFRSRRELIAENALLRTQLVVLDRHVTRAKFKPRARALMVLLSRFARSWRDAVLIIKPETVLRWHRYGFRIWWRFKSRAKAKPPRISKESVALIQEMARDNRLWGAERIRGELLKLGIRVSKRTIQRTIRSIRCSRPSGQKWATFIRNHAHETWACDFLQTYDVLFRPIFLFVIFAIGSRQVVHLPEGQIKRIFRIGRRWLQS